MVEPTAVRIVNDALVHSGHEATFDYRLKSLLMLIVDASLRQGYVDGWEDKENGKSPKITRRELIDFAELYQKSQGNR